MGLSIKLLFLLTTTIYHWIATKIETQTYPPIGKRIDIGDYKLHCYSKGQGSPTVILDHSLGGIDGYFLIDEIAKLTRVFIYDRAGYGWSDSSPYPRTSQEIVSELDVLLIKAGISPPYILVGNSFGSYNVRLYAHQFPEKVVGIILTDGLHESGMLNMSISLRSLKLFFISGFLMSTLGAILGIVRILGKIGLFEVIKPELRQFSPETRQRVKRSFYHHQHWITMARELWSLNVSSRQLSQVASLGNLPVISIKSSTFFKRSLLTFYMPVKPADRLRDKMHCELERLSTNYREIKASQSSHFVWIDEPEIIVAAIGDILEMLSCK